MEILKMQYTVRNVGRKSPDVNNEHDVIECEEL